MTENPQSRPATAPISATDRRAMWGWIIGAPLFIIALAVIFFTYGLKDTQVANSDTPAATSQSSTQ